MMNRLIGCAALGSALIALAGCYSTQEGRVKAGVPFLKDTITSRYELPMQRVHAAALAVIKRDGTLTNDDQVTKVVRGIVDGRTVWIKFDDSQPKLTELTIQARTKGGSPDVDLASEIDKRIYGELIAGK